MRTRKPKSKQVRFRLLCTLLRKSSHYPLLGDFEEVYAEIKKENGFITAAAWYVGTTTGKI
ncbi:hypothetical protein IID62_07140 [candidate division KSB1 bacterium]|nr:hypothetical protein [candidate division KSB1 bacterium]